MSGRKGGHPCCMRECIFAGCNSQALSPGFGAKGLRPVSMVYSITPADQMSLVTGL